MESTRAVFVTGVPRSGTTALRATLDRHPTFRAREDASPETKIFGDPGQLRDVEGEGGARVREFLLGDEAAASALSSSLKEVAVNGVTRGLGKWIQRAGVTGLRGAAWRFRGDHHRLRLFFHYAIQARSVGRLLEKTPVHMEFLPEMFATFPQMQALLCIRHPVEVYSSYRKKLFKAEQRSGVKDKHRWLKISLDRFCERYRTWAGIASSAPQQHPGRVLGVRYEDLTADPRRELARVCEFLGEPFEEAAIFDDLDVRRDDFGSPRPGARIVSNEKDWREFLPEEEARALEERLSPQMKTFGYESLTGSDLA